MKDIQESPLHNLFGKSSISEIAEFCESNKEFQISVNKSFEELASEPVNIALCDDRENLFAKFHELRLSSDVIEMGKILKDSNCPCKDDINNFIQIFLMQITNSILQELANVMKNKSKEDNSTINENEQKVLFYVSGFIIHAVKKKYNKVHSKNEREQKLKVIDNLTSNTCDKKYLEKFATLLEKKNRGGLKYPTEHCYLLVRSIDAVVRANTDKHLSQYSLSKCVLKEKIMEDYMVKYYTEKLFSRPVHDSSEEEDAVNSPSTYLEDIINIFLTVRGFAIARVEKNKIAMKNKSSQADKAGSSFRETLKEKCLNIP